MGRTGKRMEREVIQKAGRNGSFPRKTVVRGSKTSLEKALQLVEEPASIQILGSSGCGNNHVRFGRNFVPIQPEELPEPPFDPIPSASVTNSPADRHAQPIPRQVVFRYPDKEMSSPIRGSPSSYPLKLRGFPDPILFCQPETPRLRPTSACVLSPFFA